MKKTISRRTIFYICPGKRKHTPRHTRPIDHVYQAKTSKEWTSCHCLPSAGRLRLAAGSCNTHHTCSSVLLRLLLHEPCLTGDEPRAIHTSTSTQRTHTAGSSSWRETGVTRKHPHVLRCSASLAQWPHSSHFITHFSFRTTTGTFEILYRFFFETLSSTSNRTVV